VTEVLLQEDTDGVRVLTLNRPEARNALSGAWARRMSMTGQVIDAGRAERIGLVTEVVPHDQLMPRVMDCARAIAEVPPETVRGLKQMYAAGRPRMIAGGQG
jgi:enoyl-CoA hydratase